MQQIKRPKNQFTYKNFMIFIYKRVKWKFYILHYHANIRKALDTAMKLDIIPSNPADKIERPKKNQFIGDHYTF